MAESLLHTLIETLCCLPGVGRKLAQLMAFHLLERDREGGRRLGDTLLQAMQRIGQCERCRTLTEEALCDICGSGKRDSSQLCIVETPSELSAIEQATDYHGLYFVLHGRLSPLDGLGPRELGLDLLSQRLAEGEVEEIILATNPTIEGEATAHFVSELARAHGVRTTRIAHGVPLGGELEYTDQSTLAHAFGSRQLID